MRRYLDYILVVFFLTTMFVFSLHRKISKWEEDIVVDDGTKASIDKSVVIAALVKDVGPTIVDTYKLMKRTGNMFKEHKIIFFENNSKDSSKYFLTKICAMDKHTTCLMYNFEQYTGFLRQEESPFEQHHFLKMASFRNTLLDQVTHFDYDYAIFIDGDMLKEHEFPDTQVVRENCQVTDQEWGGVPAGFDPNAVVDTLNNAGDLDWNGLCFYGTFGDHMNNFDMKSFRSNKNTYIPQNDVSMDYEFWNDMLNAANIDSGESDITNLECSMFFFNYYKSPIRYIDVQSCFGGLIIYKMKAIRRRCLYDITTTDNEHVSFNRCVGKIFMDTQSYVHWDTKSKTQK